MLAVDGQTHASPPGRTLALLQPSAEVWQLGVGMLGFMMYKVAVLGVSLAPGKELVVEAAEQRSPTK